MSINCCFCNSVFPEKHNDSMPANEEKIAFLSKKKSCQFCTSLIERTEFLREGPKTSSMRFRTKKWLNDNIFCIFPYKRNVESKKSLTSIITESMKKCYKCFSKDHHDTEDCNDNFATAQFFQPKIDENLLQRFSQLLKPLEQYSFAFSSIAAFKSFQIKHLFVVPRMKLFCEVYFFPNFENTNILIIHEIDITEINQYFPTNPIYNNLMASLASKTLIFNVRYVSLACLEISAKNFFHLLSTKTTVLNLFGVRFTTMIKFSDILKRLPYLKAIKILFTNIKYDKLWISTCVNNCNNLEYLFLPFISTNINPECLPVYIKKKFLCKLKVYLNYDGLEYELMQGLSNYPIEICWWRDNSMHIFYSKKVKLYNDKNRK